MPNPDPQRPHRVLTDGDDTAEHRALSTPHAVRFLLDQVNRGQVALLLALMTGVSLTEGFGVLTLLPILGTMDQGGRAVRWSGWFDATLGFTPSLPALLVVMTALAALRTLLAYGRQTVSIAIQNEIVDGLRARAFGAVLHAEWRWLVRRRGSDHANLILTNVARVGLGLNQLLGAAALAIAAGGYLAAALVLSWRVALVTMALGAIVLALFGAQRARTVRFGFAIGKGSRAVHAYLQQAFAGVRIVKAYRGEDRQVAGFAAAIDDLRDQSIRNERMHARGQALLQLGSAIALALVLGIGHLGFGVALPVLLPLLLAFARLAPMLGTIQSSWATWNHMRPAIAEMQHFLDEADAMREPEAHTVAPIPLSRAIRLDRVGVRYPGRDVAALDDISLTLPVNGATAVSGPSGAGKSTLADVLMGLVAPDMGTLLVDDVPITGAARIAWRDAVAYVQQDAFLFHDTIRANILLGRVFDEPAIEAALRRAGAAFVLALPQGIDTMVGDGGARLSGGERQRVALARALIGSPSLLILDEATSALDPEHELAVRQTLRALRGEVTMLFITHRESMHGDADQVVILDRGRIA